jgi:lipopolysaccharide/colanic/teichoic acid biosynthesis glycosyltransferase
VAKRLFDVVVAALGLVAAAPVLLVAAVGIRLSSRGPLLYRARLVGRNGRLFTMYKLRTMHVDPRGSGSVITAERDPRVFRFGRPLRRLKIDELPQLVNVLRGEMSLVGPRPQHPDVVLRHYTPDDWETLRVRPGLSSPGSLYDSAHGEPLVGSADPERAYAERLLPLVLALDRVYVRRASLWYDTTLVGRTLVLIAASLLGRRTFPDPPEMAAARALLQRGAAGRITQPTKV